MKIMQEGWVRSALIPLTEGWLLLPNAVIAEVVSHRAPDVLKDAPDWLLGSIKWREKALPVISFERVIGRDLGELGHRARIIVVYGLGEDLPYYGVLAQTIPRLSQVNAENISLHPDIEGHQAVSAHVMIDGEEAWIPNVDVLSGKIAEATL